MASKATTAISLFSYPKVNLALDILGKTESGYHEIRTVFHQLSEPRDEIIIETCSDGAITVDCDNPRVPLDATNTVYKAAVLLKQYAPIPGGVKIFIKKKIPVMSGLGGGASNAVAVLKELTKLWGIRCCVIASEAKQSYAGTSKHSLGCVLLRIADQIGMDCRFFFYGGTALGEHFGEKITPLPALPASISFEVIETGVEISSRWAYEHVDLQRCGKNTDKTEKLITAIKAGDSKGIFENIHNDFEESVFRKYPRLLNVKQKITGKTKHSRFGSCVLCGSGGAYVQLKTFTA